MRSRSQYLREMGLIPWTLITDTRVIANQYVEPASNDLVSPGNVPPSGWTSLQQQVRNCTRCNLHTTRKTTVFGEGNPKANWLLVGEAPGAEEDRQGLPFVGRAGQLLNRMLFSIDLARNDVFVANVLKCRPPDNRDPFGEEVSACESFLHQQVKFIQPKIILAMGRFAAQALLRTDQTIGQLRGRIHRYPAYDIPLVVTYHPAYLLRSPQSKAKAWADLILALAESERVAGGEDV
jgi:uracil-DNA glycosylase family 4